MSPFADNPGNALPALIADWRWKSPPLSR